MEKKISHIKLSKLTFGDIEIEKKKFYCLSYINL